MFTLLAKILSVLNSEARPIQISLSVALAMLAGFNGVFSIFGLLTILLILVLRVNLASYLVFTPIFTGVAVLTSSLAHQLGERLLTGADYNVFFSQLYQTYWFRLFDLNNTLVLGNLVVSLILFIPTILLGQFLVIKYRVGFMAFVNKFKIVQSLKASKFYQIYQAVHS